MYARLGATSSLGRTFISRSVIVGLLASSLVLVPQAAKRAQAADPADTGKTTLVSVLPGGGVSPSLRASRAVLSADGRYAVFTVGRLAGGSDVVVRDRITGVLTTVSVSSAGVVGNGNSALSSISADGHYVVFESDATNLVPNDTNATWDIFVRDLWAGTTTRVSVAYDGSQLSPGYIGGSCFCNVGSRLLNHNGGAISADGRYVLFYSGATNVVPNDTNNQVDTFVRDLQTGTNTVVSA